MTSFLLTHFLLAAFAALICLARLGRGQYPRRQSPVPAPMDAISLAIHIGMGTWAAYLLWS